MKKIISVFISIFIVLSTMSSVVYANTPITVLLNGEKIEFDVEPIIYSGRTFVPIRAVYEKMGADVYWLEFENDHNGILIVKDNIKIALEPNVTTYTVLNCENYEEFVGWIEGTVPEEDDDNVFGEMDVPPIVVNGRTLLPIRAVCEVLGATVTWDEGTSTVLVEYANANTKNTDTEFCDKIYEFLMGVLEMDIANGNVSSNHKYETTITFKRDYYDKKVESLILNKLSWSGESGDVDYTFKYCPSEMILVVKHNNDVDVDYIRNQFTIPKLEFADAYGNVIIDASDILKIEVKKDDEVGYYIQITLTDEGRQKFATATREISMKSHYENHISIMLDGMIISSPAVNAEIDTTTMAITGEIFTEDTVWSLASEMQYAVNYYDIIIKDIYSVSHNE